MWTDSTIVLQWLSSTTQHPIFNADRVCEIFEHTILDEWNRFASSDNPADAGTRVMFAEVLQSSLWVKVRKSNETNNYRSNQAQVVNNMKLGIVTKNTEYTKTSLATSATKSSEELGRKLMLFHKFIFFQKLLRITAYKLQMLTSHECYRYVNGSIKDPTELDEQERLLQYLLHKEYFNSGRKDLQWKQIF